ncbi:MAG: hypothetical protein ACYTFI_10715, partial [Planctomycetota bacterium]
MSGSPKHARDGRTGRRARRPGGMVAWLVLGAAGTVAAASSALGRGEARGGGGPVHYRYDCGGPGTAAANGYFRLTIKDVYTERKGRGIVPSEAGEERGWRRRGRVEDTRYDTFVFDGGGLRFVQDLPAGEYLVSLASGDAQYKGAASIKVNGRELSALRKTAPGEFLVVTGHKVKIGGGRLTVEIGGYGRLNWIEIAPAGSAEPAASDGLTGTVRVIRPGASSGSSAPRGKAPEPVHDPFGEIRKARSNSTVNMHLLPKAEFEVGTDRWGPIVRVNMLKIRDWSKVPGVKKAWPMKGYEGVEGMAFHPVISEVKDVDGDGVVDIFRCRSEHEGARIERLRYADGSVVWQSAPMGALHGDESRLAVFDLDGDGVFSVLHSTKSGVYCVSAKTGETEWARRAAVGDLTAGRFHMKDASPQRAPRTQSTAEDLGNGKALDPPSSAGSARSAVKDAGDRKRQGVLVRSAGTLRCYDHAGRLSWTHETGLKGGSAYSHELYRFDADGDGLDEIFANWQKLTMALRGDGTVLWEDRTQRHHSDYIVGGDLDGDGATELLYDHQGCGAEKGPLYVVDAMSGKVRLKIDYRADGLRHAQNMALGDFDKDRPGLEIAMCGKRGGLMMWDSGGRPVWKRNVPASLLSKGDWDGDGAEEITCHALGANVDGMF